jgi:hypothetical protein
MAGEEEQQVVARAEPQECSRWAVIGLLACVAVALDCLGACQMINLEHTTSPCLGLLVGYLLLLLGLFVSAACIFLADELLSGDDPYGEMYIDRLLSL